VERGRRTLDRAIQTGMRRAVSYLPAVAALSWRLEVRAHSERVEVCLVPLCVR